ncbi:hypothetical protein PInf_016346 [Phytophthora infestans]|nr:hypothetical protein PInf_016343 [Phytophthora infestans]KAI9993825.1 hypothetical protein PInf_016346 [Phytophthora infestans]
MPPRELHQLRCASFPAPRTRTKGEYHPPQAHQLAAHRIFKELNSETGKWLSPMSFVLHLRELDSVRFDAPPAVLMAIYSGRLVSRGLTVMHFRSQSELEQLRRGSSNANFSVDFGASASLPVMNAQCQTYEDLLAAIGGLVSLGDALWYDHVRRLLSRLKRFVLANKKQDESTPERVLLTLLHVNQFLGKALAHLMMDAPHWWRDFSEAVRAVDYHSPDWQAALNGLALRLAAKTPGATSFPPATEPRTTQTSANSSSRRGSSSRVPVMPDDIRRLIPRDTDGNLLTGIPGESVTKATAAHDSEVAVALLVRQLYERREEDMPIKAPHGLSLLQSSPTALRQTRSRPKALPPSRFRLTLCSDVAWHLHPRRQTEYHLGFSANLVAHREHG